MVNGIQRLIAILIIWSAFAMASIALLGSSFLNGMSTVAIVAIVLIYTAAAVLGTYLVLRMPPATG